MREFEQTAVAFHRACQEAEVPYVLIGGIAVMAWGQPRSTMDIDALVDLQPGRIEAFIRSLSEQDLTALQHDLEAALRDGSHVTVFDERSNFHVDVKPALESTEQAEIERAVEIPFEGTSLRFVPPEETVAFKLLFASPQDLQDARSILVRQEGHLDREHLEALTKKLGVSDRLQALEQELGD